MKELLSKEEEESKLNKEKKIIINDIIKLNNQIKKSPNN